MSTENFDLISVKNLLDKRFFIPSYQRGYRWGKKQVDDLLNDINDSEMNYCIQPLVVKIFDENEYNSKDKQDGTEKKEVKYIVIDGQQRLTTIFLILKALRENNIYSLKYETRSDSESFLNKIEKKDNKEKIPDFWYIQNAYNYIMIGYKKMQKQKILEIKY